MPDLDGRDCTAGLDLSTTTDLSCLCLAVPDGKLVHLVPYFWAPAEQVRQRAFRDQVPYETWVRQGHIETTPGPDDRLRHHPRAHQRNRGRAEHQEHRYDPWNATGLVKDLIADGFNMVPVRQGFVSMSAPTKEFERRLLAGELNHRGNPILRWQANNVTVRTDPAGNLKPDKQKSADRIDGIVAAILALSALEQVPEAPQFQFFVLG